MEEADVVELIAERDALLAESERHRNAWVTEAERANTALAELEQVRSFCERRFHRPVMKLADLTQHLAFIEQQAKEVAKQPFEDGKRHGHWQGRSEAFDLVKKLMKKLHKEGRIEGHAWAVIDDAIDDAIMEGWYGED